MMEERFIFLESQLCWIPFASGIVFLLVGKLIKNFPPADINGLYGYRTARSMKDQESWDFAQIEGGTQMFRFGKIGIAIGIVGLFIPLREQWDFYLGLTWLLISCGFLIYFTEKSLIRKFGK